MLFYSIKKKGNFIKVPNIINLLVLGLRRRKILMILYFILKETAKRYNEAFL